MRIFVTHFLENEIKIPKQKSGKKSKFLIHLISNLLFLSKLFVAVSLSLTVLDFFSRPRLLFLAYFVLAFLIKWCFLFS